MSDHYDPSWPDLEKPDYIVHTVEEKDVTVDWFFGGRPFRQQLPQLLLVIVGWFFAILPIVITVDALIHRDDPLGWWNYREGFQMWDITIATLGLLLAAFIIGFLILFLLNRRQEKVRDDTVTYDEERLAMRLALADELYENKFGPPSLREQQKTIRVEPYGDFETYELRDYYRKYGVD